MANPVALPGTVVPSGAAVSPGGAQGPTAVSANANNKATLGTDSLVLVQGTAAGVAATTHAQTVSGDDPQLTTLASASTKGLLNQTSGNATDFLDGTNHFQPLGPVIVGGPAGTAKPSGGILVPRYANHPDGVWTPMGAFDDHFDGSSLDAKWALTTSGAVHPLSFLTNAVAASKFSLGGVSGANDNNTYQAYAIQTLPNANSFTVTIRLDLLLACDLSSGSQGFVTFRLYNGTANVGLDTVFNNAYSTGAAVPINLISFSGGTNLATTIKQLGTGKPPQYVRLVWSTTNAGITIYASEDGASWIWLTVVSSAQSGFTTSNPPLNFWLMANAVNSGRVMFQVDWVKFTNP